MAGIAFVTSYINDIVDKDVEIGVDLDQTVIISLIPVVSSPRLVRDKFQVETFIIGQFKMQLRALPAFRDSSLNDRIKFSWRNHETFCQLLQPDIHGAFPGQNVVQRL